MGAPDAKQQILAGVKAVAGDDGDLGRMEDVLPGLTGYLREFAADDFVCALVAIPPNPRLEVPGVEGLEQAWREWGGTFESVHATLQEIRESARHLVLLVDQIAVTRHGVEVSQPSAMLWEFDDGKVKRLEFHLDRAEALRIAGLAGSGQSSQA